MSNVEHARRAVKCPPWRWMPGMLHSIPAGPIIRNHYPETGRRWETQSPPYETRIFDNPLTDGGGLLTGGYEGCPKSDTWLPRFDDAATFGCLVALVRTAWGDENAFADPRGGWHVCISSKGPEHGHDIEIDGDSEVDAWIAALEQAARYE